MEMNTRRSRHAASPWASEMEKYSKKSNRSEDDDDLLSLDNTNEAYVAMRTRKKKAEILTTPPDQKNRASIESTSSRRKKTAVARKSLKQLRQSLFSESPPFLLQEKSVSPKKSSANVFSSPIESAKKLRPPKTPDAYSSPIRSAEKRGRPPKKPHRRKLSSVGSWNSVDSPGLLLTPKSKKIPDGSLKKKHVKSLPAKAKAKARITVKTHRKCMPLTSRKVASPTQGDLKKSPLGRPSISPSQISSWKAVSMKRSLEANVPSKLSGTPAANETECNKPARNAFVGARAKSPRGMNPAIVDKRRGGKSNGPQMTEITLKTHRKSISIGRLPKSGTPDKIEQTSFSSNSAGVVKKFVGISEAESPFKKSPGRPRKNVNSPVVRGRPRNIKTPNVAGESISEAESPFKKSPGRPRKHVNSPVVRARPRNKVAGEKSVGGPSKSSTPNNEQRILQQTLFASDSAKGKAEKPVKISRVEKNLVGIGSSSLESPAKKSPGRPRKTDVNSPVVTAIKTPKLTAEIQIMKRSVGRPAKPSTPSNEVPIFRRTSFSSDSATGKAEKPDKISRVGKNFVGINDGSSLQSPAKKSPGRPRKTYANSPDVRAMKTPKITGEIQIMKRSVGTPNNKEPILRRTLFSSGSATGKAEKPVKISSVGKNFVGINGSSSLESPAKKSPGRPRKLDTSHANSPVIVESRENIKTPEVTAEIFPMRRSTGRPSDNKERTLFSSSPESPGVEGKFVRTSYSEEETSAKKSRKTLESNWKHSKSPSENDRPGKKSRGRPRKKRSPGRPKKSSPKTINFEDASRSLLNTTVDLSPGRSNAILTDSVFNCFTPADNRRPIKGILSKSLHQDNVNVTPKKSVVLVLPENTPVRSKIVLTKQYTPANKMYINTSINESIRSITSSPSNAIARKMNRKDLKLAVLRLKPDRTVNGTPKSKSPTIKTRLLNKLKNAASQTSSLTALSKIPQRIKPASDKKVTNNSKIHLIAHKEGFNFKTKSVTNKEQAQKDIEKTRTLVNTVQNRRDTIKGVRSNRRFDLLMNMRKKNCN